MGYLNYIDVFNNEGRDTDEPILTLCDDESIRLFFELVTSSSVYRRYFQDGKIALVSFHVYQDLQTGTGYYEVVNGKIKVVSETGVLKDVLKRVGFTNVEDSSYLPQDHPEVVELLRQLQAQYESIGKISSVVAATNVIFLRNELWERGWNTQLQQDGKTVVLVSRTDKS